MGTMFQSGYSESNEIALFSLISFVFIFKIH